MIMRASSSTTSTPVKSNRKTVGRSKYHPDPVAAMASAASSSSTALLRYASNLFADRFCCTTNLQDYDTYDVKRPSANADYDDNSIEASAASASAATAVRAGGEFEGNKYDIDESEAGSDQFDAEDAAQWQQSLKRQSFDQAKSAGSSGRRSKSSAAGAGGTTQLLLPCSSCLPSSSDLLSPTTTTTTRWNDSSFLGNGPSSPSSTRDRREGLKQAPPSATPVTPCSFGSSPASAFVMPDSGGFAVPMKRVQSFGTATTASVTTCDTMTLDSGSVLFPNAAWQEATAVDIIPASSTQMALEDSDSDDDNDWDCADSTTTTEVVSHCQNPFRERCVTRGQHRMLPEDSENNQVAYRFLKRMSPNNYVHDSSDDEEDIVGHGSEDYQVLSRAYSNEDILDDLSHNDSYYSYRKSKKNNKRWKSSLHHHTGYNNYHYKERDLMGLPASKSVDHRHDDPAASPSVHQFSGAANHWLQPRQPASFSC